MPVGPQGQKRPKNPNAAAVMVGKIATGRMEEQYVDGASAAAGKSSESDQTDPAETTGSKTTTSGTVPKT